MQAEARPLEDSDNIDLKAEIEHQAYALFAGKAGKGGASEIVRMIGKRAEGVAKRHLELARESVKARKSA
jgi:hypothetical protein